MQNTSQTWSSQGWPAYQLPQHRGNGPLGRVRDWLDERGKPAWIVATILGFVVFWPVGLGILGYMIWSKRMFGNRSCAQRAYRSSHFSAPTGNAAFDAYRDETLKRLEDEHREFLNFLAKLREAKDKAEFDQFIQQRDHKSPDQSQ